MQKGFTVEWFSWKWIVFGLLILGSSCVFAQDLSYRQFTIEDGLPSNQIYDIHQDQKGFIWFATENGLSRYDGAKFINYTLSDGLPDTEIISFFEDSKSRIWFCAFNGILGFYQDGVFHNAKNTEFLREGYLNNSTSSAIEDQDGNIYFSSYKLVIKINPQNVLTKINVDFHIGLVKDIHGQVYSYKEKEADMQLTKIPQLESVPFDSVVFDNENKYELFFSGKTDFSTVHPVSASFKKKFIPKVNHFVLKKNNAYWLSSPTSPLQILTVNKEGVLDLQYSLDNLNLSKGIIDREKYIWYGSLGKGVFRFDKSSAKVYRLGEHLGGELLSSLFIDKSTNQIYCGTSDGVLNVISDDDIRVLKIPAGDRSNPRIRDIEKDNFDRLWLTCDAFLLAYDAKNLKQNDIVNMHTRVGAPKDVTIDQESNDILVATNNWTFRYEMDGEVLASRNILLRKRSTCIHIDEEQQIWSGTTKGLFYYPNNDPKPKIKSIGEDPISCINHLGKTILAGTKGKGLLVVRGDSIINNFSTKDGLPSNLIRSIQIFDDQSVWLSTNQGLCKIDNILTPDFSILVINEENGLISNDIIDCGIIDSMLYVLCSNGLSRLKFSEIEDNLVSPKINLEQILVNDENVPIESIKKLNSKQNNISFVFSGIHFGNRNSLIYTYKLNGYHENWHKTSNNNLVFEQLPPGEYSFEIYATLNGTQSSKTEKMDFEIVPAFYQRKSIQLLGLGFIGFGFFLFTRYLFAREQEKNKVEKRLLQLEQMALQSQMNPHFIKNALGAIQHLMIKKDVRTANKYLTVFGELITQLLQQPDQSQIKISEEIKILELYLSIEKLRFDNNFEYQIIYDAKGILDQMIPSMMIQPLVENAIIHGFRDTSSTRKNKLKIDLELQNGYLICVVEDNGSGMKKVPLPSLSTTKRQGIAMKNIKERISLLAIKKTSTNFEIVKTNEKGTLIKLSLPLSEDYD